jgi:hypothetical protein
MPLSGEEQSYTFTQFYREPERKTIRLVTSVTNSDLVLDQRFPSKIMLAEPTRRSLITFFLE